MIGVAYYAIITLKAVTPIIPSLRFVRAWSLTLASLVSIHAQGAFTIQVGDPPVPPTPLVNHGDLWRYRKGTSQPPAGWQTVADAGLDGTWLTGAGGFGYADNSGETALVQTPLTDMQNNYTTLYLRRTFQVADTINPALHLRLTVDWDDGFVAYLDGVEIQRGLARTAAGVEPPYNDTASGGHESSRGNTAPPNPPSTYDLGPVGDRLSPGPHVLAVLCLNATSSSSDLIMIADLAVGGSESATGPGALFAIVNTNSVSLSGTNIFPGAARVVVDGRDAAFDAGSGDWSTTQSLNPGFNRILVRVLDGAGIPLFATNQDIVAELASTSVGGTLGPQTSWDDSMGIIHVTSSVVVPAGGTLSIGAGTVFLISPGASFRVTGGTIAVTGTESQAVYFLPADGVTIWGELVASGPGGHLLIQHAETMAGHVEVLNGAEGTIEDSYLHHYEVSSPAIVHTLGTPNPATLNMRRCHVAHYYEILCQVCTNHFEDCLCEYQAAGGDGIDFDAGQPGSYIRHCTVRHAKFANVDALDMGEYGATGVGSQGVLVDGCLLYDFADKGISMGIKVDITVTNCLIYGVDAGIAVKDNSVTGVYNTTIVNNAYGFHCYNKANSGASTGGGHITNSFNNILWNNSQEVVLLNGSTMTANYCDIEATSYPGTGNITTDPLFWNVGLRDYRLREGSPALASGLDGAHMGATYPVGAPMAASHPRFESVTNTGEAVELSLYADPERSYTVQYSDAVTGGVWHTVAHVWPEPLPRLARVSDSFNGATARYYRIVSPAVP
jgi:Right handed beta helix region